jgi:hypothetical protein
MLQNPRTAKSQFFGKIKIRQRPQYCNYSKALKKWKDFHERVDKRIDDLLANYLIFYTF